MIKVKICGITNLKDARACAKAGADMVGFIFAKSTRKVLPTSVRSIISKLPKSIKKVGVFVNEKQNAVNRLVRYCGLDFVQLHGEETPGYCKKIKCAVIKAFRIGDRRLSLKDIKRYEGCVEAVLLDTYIKGKRGGTGRPFNWSLAKKIKTLGIPVILSGGLSPENIGDAVKKVRPFAIDLNSGVEDSPGKKNAKMLLKAVEIARRSCIMA